MIRPRMAMDKLKQALGLQITDEQLLQLLKDDYENKDIGNDAHFAAHYFIE